MRCEASRALAPLARWPPPGVLWPSARPRTGVGTPCRCPQCSLPLHCALPVGLAFPWTRALSTPPPLGCEAQIGLNEERENSSWRVERVREQVWHFLDGVGVGRHPLWRLYVDPCRSLRGRVLRCGLGAGLGRRWG